MLLRALLLLASVAAFSPASQPGRFPRRAIVSSSIREADLEDLITLALSQREAAARDSLVAGAVRSWAPAERAALSNAMSDALSARGVSIQSDALAAHERGEDVTEASQTLQTLVDMTVQVKLLTKRLAQASAGAATDD